MSEDVTRRAEALIEVGRMEQAIALLLAEGVPYEGSARACCLLSQAHYAQREWMESLGAADRALERDPTNTWALRLRALALSELGWHPEAIDCARRAVAIAPFEPSSHHVLASCLRRGGDLKAAAEVADHLVELAPAKGSSHAIAGLVALDQRRNRKAQAHFTAALELDPMDHTAHNNLGVVARRRWRLLTARRHYRSALRLSPLPVAENNLIAVRRLWTVLAIIAGVVVLVGLLKLVAPDFDAGVLTPLWFVVAWGFILITKVNDVRRERRRR